MTDRDNRPAAFEVCCIEKNREDPAGILRPHRMHDKARERARAYSYTLK